MKPKAREQVLVQLGSATQVNALRVGHKWQRRQRAAELTRLVEESQAAMYVVTDDWNVLRSWDAICRLHRRQQVSGWSLKLARKCTGFWLRNRWSAINYARAGAMRWMELS